MNKTFKFGSKANLLETKKNVEWGIEQDQMKQPAPSMLKKRNFEQGQDTLKYYGPLNKNPSMRMDQLGGDKKSKKLLK